MKVGNMMLSLDVISLGVPAVRAAHEFCTSVFSPIATDHGQYVSLDMHGTDQVAASS